MKNYTSALRLTAGALLAAACLPAGAQAQATGAQAVLTPSLNLRVRLESAQQDNAAKDAQAFTVRHRMGLATRRWNALQLFAETEGVHALASERYNSGPGGNGRNDFSVIADPTDNELNQIWVNWTAHEGLQAKLGRQRLIFGNARFLGNVGWRQNEQTYDAMSLNAQLGDSIAVDYAYLRNVNRIFFDQLELNGHALRLDWTASLGFNPYAFSYLLDFDTAADSQTFGLGIHGSWPSSWGKFGYRLVYAKQQDFADASPLDVDYQHAEIVVSNKHGWRVVLGREVLGSDGQQAFSTPLATLHKFNGWADVFLGTPPTGLVDQYVTVAYVQGPGSASIVYHVYEADQGGEDYGSEIDLLLAWKWAKAHSALLKYADYTSDGFAVDTQRITLEWNWRFSA